MARRHLPDTRPSVTRKVSCGELELYITVGFHPDEDTHEPAEVFIRAAKEGSTLQGLLNGFCLVTSIALQYGVPWTKLAEHLRHTRFEPSDDQYSSALDCIAASVTAVAAEREEMWAG